MPKAHYDHARADWICDDCDNVTDHCVCVAHERYCKIVDGSVGTGPSADDDGAYDLFNRAGTPDEIGKAIADSLKTTDLLGGRGWHIEENGGCAFVRLTIRIAPNRAVHDALPEYEDDENDEVE
jgi:hypothetical protein